LMIISIVVITKVINDYIKRLEKKEVDTSVPGRNAGVQF